jgi:hypothetical protein
LKAFCVWHPCEESSDSRTFAKHDASDFCWQRRRAKDVSQDIVGHGAEALVFSVCAARDVQKGEQ